MRKEDTLRLHTHALAHRIAARELKQTWLAAQVGVDKKTVGRWLNGQVKRLARGHAARLATVLGCAVSDLTVPDEADVLATKEEQRVAARLIQERDLLARLSPTDDWRLAETIIRATLQPDLPLATLGRLYNLLSIACWRQGGYDEALRHAARAREIGARCGDRTIVCGATYNDAVIESLRGDHAAALAAYERCLARPEDFETPRERGKVLSNLGVAYRDVLRFDDALRTQQAAIDLFGELGLDLNLAIAWVSHGHALTEVGRFDEAKGAHQRAAEHARRAGYQRGLDCAPIYEADPTSLGGGEKKARELVVAALPGLARHEVYDLGLHEIAARVLRRAGDLDGAAAQVKEGLRRSADFPGVHAFMRLEEARLALARKDTKGEARAREAANEAFRRAGLGARVLTKRVREHGA